MRCFLTAISILNAFVVYGQTDNELFARRRQAQADSAYNADMQAIAKKERNRIITDSIALSKIKNSEKDASISIDAIDLKNGFRDLKFGVSVSQVHGLVPYGKAVQGEQMYTRPTDSKKVGDATLAAIYYTFYKGKLEAVTLETKGFSNGQAVLEAFRKLYGTPSKFNPYIEDYIWSGEKVIASFERNTVTEKRTMYIISKIVSGQMKTDRERIAKKATSDL